MGCADFVDDCSICAPPGRNTALFFLGDKYCEHLQEKHGHEIAMWDDFWND